MAARLTDEQAGFIGGLNANGLYEPIDGTQFGTCSNMRLVRNMEMAKRTGLKLLANVASPSTFAWMKVWYPSGAAPQLLYGLSGDTSLWYATFNASTGAITSTNVAGDYVIAGYSSAQFRDATAECVYIAHEEKTSVSSTKLAKFNGTTVTINIGTAVNLRTIWVYNQRLFGVTRDNQTLYWSALNNGDTIGDTANGGGSATIRTYGASNVMGGVAIGNTNFILHERGLSKFVGRTFDDIAIQAGTEGVSPHYQPLSAAGSYEQGLPIVVDGIGYWPTYQGLILLTEDEVRPYQTPELPDPLLAYVRANPRVECGPLIENIRANEIWFTLFALEFDTSFRSTRTFVYNKQLQRFTGTADFMPGGYFANLAGSFVAAGSRSVGLFIPQVFFWCNIGGAKLFGVDFATTSLEVYQDNAANYTSSVQCRRFFTGQPQSTKSWRGAYVQMGNGGAAALAVGASTGATLAYTTPIGGSVSDTTSLKALQTNEIQLSGQGQYVDVTITDAGAVSTDWSVQRVDVSGFDLGLRGT